MESEISTEKLIGLFRALAAILIQGLSACQLVQDFIAKYGLTEEERKVLTEAIKHCDGTVKCLSRILNAITPENLPSLEEIDFSCPFIPDSQNIERLCAIVGIEYKS